ncbi:MAG: hypothetical protein ABSA49_01175 [Rhizomicrobium sp.]|jgi:hypothetical protein
MGEIARQEQEVSTMRNGTHMPIMQRGEQSSGGQAGSGQAGSGQDGGQKRRGHLRQHGGVGMLLHHADDFGLEDHDIEALETLQEKHELEKAKLEYEEQAAKIKLRYAMHRGNATEAEVKKAAQAVAAAETELRMMRFHHLKGARDALKTSSPSKVVDVKSFVRKKRGEFGQGGGQRGAA